MKSPSVTGNATSSESVNGSNPSVSSSRATTMASASESRPESSSTRSSVSGGSARWWLSATARISAMTDALMDMTLVAENDRLQQRAQKVDALEHLGGRHRPCERHLGIERAVELERVRHVADAV